MNTIEKKLWFFHRFGITPTKFTTRILYNSIKSKIICICIPKSGTHLLERALCIHPCLYRKFIRTVHEENYKQLGGLDHLFRSLSHKQILMTHLFFTPERQQMLHSYNLKSIFMIRDPRDTVVSDTFYIKKKTDHKMHQFFKDHPDFDQCLRTVITGEPYYESIAYRLENFSGWLDSDALTVRFEDIIGQRGGGNDTLQHNTLRSLFEYLDIEIHDHDIDMIQSKLFSSASPTYRSGQTSQWRQYFSEEMKDLFKQTAGKYLIQYGYERDYNW